MYNLGINRMESSFKKYNRMVITYRNSIEVKIIKNMFDTYRGGIMPHGVSACKIVEKTNITRRTGG